jgi:class 3 adenylate cyclase
MDSNCSRCASPLPADARFCPACGEPVPGAAVTDPARTARVAAAVPPSLAAKMRAPRFTGERKPVTALFADVVGSTSLAETMDPEDYTAIINEGIARISEAVYRYEGTIAKLLGDGVLAFFGAPVAHEDDPERAVRAALDIVTTIHEYGTELRAGLGLDFDVRIGINTGPVVVGNVGSDLHYEFTPLGDSVNVAARLQAAAPPGGILVTGATRRFVAAVAETEALGEIEVKGRSEPVDAHRVVGLRATPGRSRGIAGLESDMVGRDVELARLEESLAAVQAGRGRVAVILGEAGLGKSRLIAELRRFAGSHGDGAWAEGRSRSYGMNLPYHVLLDVVRAIVGAPVGAGEAETRAALEARIGELFGRDGDETREVLAHLLSLPVQGALADDLERIEPEALQARYLGALRRLLEAIAARGPLVLVCEDLHWADASSVEALGRLLPIVNEQPILLLIASRADREAPGWRLVTMSRDLFGDTLVEIPLRPLSEDDSRRLIANLLDIEQLPDAIRDVILAKAEGNPFFVEEVVRMLIEQRAIVRADGRWVATTQIDDVEIPDTIHGLLLARIDRLPEEAKRALRVASVIGRQFSVRVLEEVLTTTADR